MESFFVVVTLTIRQGAESEFRQYESRAAGIMARYGGVIERTVAVAHFGAGEEREVHVLRFPSESEFQQYRADEELSSLAEWRSRCISRTEILCGREGPRYTDDPGAPTTGSSN